MKLWIKQLVGAFSSKTFLNSLLLLGVLSFLLFPLGASALFEAGSLVSDVKLISAVEGVGDQKTIWVALDIHLKPGWKTYWRTPGASGYGLKIDWSESQNLQSAELYWPVPAKFETFKFIANGYKDRVVFPIQITLKKEHTSLFLNAKLDYLACDIANCIPQNKIVTLMVPNGPDTPSTNAKDITSALKRLPEKSNPDLSIKSAQFIPNENAAPYLRLVVLHKSPLVLREIFVEGRENFFFDTPISVKTTYSADGGISTIDIPIYKNQTKQLLRTANLMGEKIIITLQSKDKTIEQKVSVIAPPLKTEDMFIILGFALLGGFILNFMPCVLPVILLKIFSLTKYGGRSVASVRKALFLSILGIISSFMILALIPIFLGFLGISFGWGMQFQEPIFLVFMMFVITLFAANFWGFFEIVLPENITSLSYDFSEKEGNWGHYLSGMFATLLATPCSAPYLGTAVTFALSRGPFEIFLVFFLFGIGLSLPFIFVMIFPKMVTFLPKPGKWMNVFKILLGWVFFFVMLWLFYILTNQISLFAAFFILSIMLGILFVFWLGEEFPYFNRIYVLYAVFIPLLLLAELSINKVIPQKISVKYTLNTIQLNVKKGKIVFVDVTADWCLTCKANEYLVLEKNDVKNLMKKNGVIFIKLDWTSKGPEIYEYLRSFDRNGIPFYAVYGPHSTSGQPLPQILTFSNIDEAIKKAK